MKILAFVTDAFGGRGGIAQHNRHLLDALCAHPSVETVVTLPRMVAEDVGALPARLVYRTDVAGSKARYVARAARLIAARGPRFDIVVCGHMNLLPLAALAARRDRSRLVLVAHGIEAWSRPGPLRRRATRRVDLLVAVSDFTRRRVLEWADLPEARTAVIPNAIDVAAFGRGERRRNLMERYGIAGRRVILTLSRLSAAERYKGHDEVLEALPDVLREIPDATYLIAGDGDDRARLEAKAAMLGLTDRVAFTGYVPDAEKVDHYRLADVFAMPGHGEGFGIAYLEALACGVPVVASSRDASREAVLDGELGRVVDPSNRAELVRALVAGLREVDRSVPARLDRFDVAAFRRLWFAAIERVWLADSSALSDRRAAGEAVLG